MARREKLRRYEMQERSETKRKSRQEKKKRRLKPDRIQVKLFDERDENRRVIGYVGEVWIDVGKSKNVQVYQTENLYKTEEQCERFLRNWIGSRNGKAAIELECKLLAPSRRERL